ncbi:MULTISPECIES: flagellar basal body-associated protein FliL [unclassified Shewanella]|uniref:flagellar basal body-associated protein FliL n=1 Tax=unclassified Shewanella TaxID=196818 RepID=UPI000C83A5D9|nr:MULTISPECIES: flagellar basal body-associated protein FliL [unclassified Shewanella]MDO6619665.1 flagellar basal body-associated protein FliL [Shewanella sp. 6_MG-2023]MDO6640620.1 flagellar basal body-associated protein FliL [Shewanella sp. 5_MG-2023]MDO6678753.1 flagellar basal body-associated protein FliL [Shewanella sp. 4_MG-2023]MDO6775769.1 flagellar basal body-associated protein FliL [Shewanella sp. 3_MG-2023]PMG29154.1 flagellar basal body-associated protein FliL [Shewanella sp. 10N
MAKYLFAVLVALFFFPNAHSADDKATGNFAYYGFEPDIVTNYISNRKKLGFVKISVELMVKDPKQLQQIEHHDPLLRAAIVEVLGNQPEDKVKSLTGREDIRRACFETVNRLLEAETGEQSVVNLLFTKYLYD